MESQQLLASGESRGRPPPNPPVMLLRFVASPAVRPLAGAITCHNFALRNHLLRCCKNSCMRRLYPSHCASDYNQPRKSSEDHATRDNSRPSKQLRHVSRAGDARDARGENQELSSKRIRCLMRSTISDTRGEGCLVAERRALGSEKELLKLLPGR